MVKHTKENGTKEGIETSLKKEFDTDSDSISVAGGQTYSSDEGLEESETGSEYSESEELMTDEKEDTDKEENDVDFVLARVELANAMLNMDPKAVIIEKNKLKTNKETLDSLMGNKNISNNSHITGKSVSRRKNSKKIKKNRRDSESRDEESRETGLDLIDDKDDVLSGYKVREWNNQKRMSKENEVYDKSNGNRKQRQKNNVTDSDADADFQGYGENKIPDFIIQAKSMKDIDEITQNWEENLKQEQEGGFWGSIWDTRKNKGGGLAGVG
ncbi:hypothetical protein AX774_g1002 [Zancudomyces culisetae]|uniref:Uncharacterized protein n=1 Tax=Zancudomyces culisetae TaxID=1213189 RepID=A0A1R1PWT4_ZANCU|nr:hypothetical protein AX774_g1002 [Zancudomyces culisetae]|eukprot:OMH85450.1 hypothetical protein AX774_g1002 [Zancudomyces culisetae]